jgi:hypothetical protein
MQFPTILVTSVCWNYIVSPNPLKFKIVHFVSSLFFEGFQQENNGVGKDLIAFSYLKI